MNLKQKKMSLSNENVEDVKRKIEIQRIAIVVLASIVVAFGVLLLF